MDKSLQPTEEKKDNKPDRITVAKVDEYYRTAEDWNELRQMMVNTNYYVGNQWIGWNRGDRRIIMLPIQDSNQERITLNKIRPRVLTLLAKHTKNKIKFNVVAGSKEDKDIDAAKGADKFLKFLWNELGMSQKTVMIFLNMLIKSKCAVKTWFDAEAGDDITPVEGDPGYDKDDNSKVYKGEIRARVCDPMTIFYDPAATCEEEIRWVLERRARDVDELFEEYGIKVVPDANLDPLNSFDITNINSEGIGGSEIKRKQNMALTSELWLKPCKKYPKGVKICTAGGQELDYTEEAGELPYTIIGYTPIPGTMRFDSIVKDMIPVQRGINIKRSMIATHAKRVGNSMWTVPLESAVDEEELSNEISGIIHFSAAHGMKPERVPAPDIPSFYDRDLANDAADLDDMSGAREVSQGSMPKGLDTLGGLQIMVEQENEKLTVGAMSYEEGMKKVMSRILRLVHKHYKEDRQAKIIGEDNEIEIITFNASDLTGDEDIEIVQGSSLPEMKAAQEERLMLLWDKGVFLKNGVPDTDTFMRLMNMGDATQAYEQKHLDDNKSKMENKYFESLMDDKKAAASYLQYVQQKQQIDAMNQQMQQQGQQQMQPMPQPQAPKGVPVVRDFQDHEVHLFNHNSFRKCTEYEELSPEFQQLVDAHVKEHETMMQQTQQQMQSSDPHFQAMQEKTQAVQAANELKQQELQLTSQTTQAKTQAELQKQQMQTSTEQAKLQVGAMTQAAQQQHEQQMAHMNAGRQLSSDMIKAEQSHGHQLLQGEVNHQRSLQTSHIGHSQQLQRDQQNNKNKGSGKK